MANSKIGQYQLEFRLEGFTAPIRSHALRLWVDPVGVPSIGDVASSIDIQKRGGGNAALDVVANQAWGFFRLCYATVVQATGFSLWRYATETSRDFISGGTLTTPAGVTGGISAAAQTTLSFRHANGGIGKIVLLESNTAGDTRTALVANAAGTQVQRVAAYMMSADGIMTALDNSFPITPLRDSRGQNEAIWKLLYRSGS